MLRTFLVIGFLIGFVFLLAPGAADAAGLVACGGFELDSGGNRILQPLEDPIPAGWDAFSDSEMVKLEPTCQLCDTFKLVKEILDGFLFPFVPIIGALLLAIGGFFMFMGGASPQMLSRGKTILIATFTGLIIVYTSWLFINFFLNFMGFTTWQGIGNWWEIDCPISQSVSEPPPPPPPVSGPPPPPAVVSTLSFSVVGGNITPPLNSTVELDWDASSNFARCDAQSDWTGQKPLQGPETVGPLPLAQTYIFTLLCTPPGVGQGLPLTKSVFITPGGTGAGSPPVINTWTINEENSAVTVNGSSLLTMVLDTTNADSCFGNHEIPQIQDKKSGTFEKQLVGAARGDYLYTVDCFNSTGQTTSATVIVKIILLAPP